MHDRMAALEAETRRLADIEAIRGLIAQYAIAADRKNDPAIMRRLFAEDGVWESDGFGRFVGRETICAALSDVARQQILWTLHYMISPSIHVRDDTADVSWYLWELATIAAEGGEKSIWCGGTYDAICRRDAGGWLFHELRLNVRLATPFDHPWGLNPRGAL